MFARLRIDLGFYVLVQTGQDFDPIEVEEGGFRFLIRQPYKSGITASDRDVFQGRPPMDVTHALEPVDPQPTLVRVDGRPAIVADSVQVDILGDALTRESGAVEAAIPAAFNVVNHFLQRLRAVAGSAFVRPVQPDGVYWYLEYLNDDGSEFPPDPAGDLVRRRLATRFRIPAMPMLQPDGVWASTRELPDEYVLPPWESLFLDARLLLESDRLTPEVGPAIVLAASAIETRIDDALRSDAQRHGGPALELWSWLTNRDQWWREPSFAEKLSVVLAALARRSLKDDNDLWEAFQNLREARNKYVHEGIASIGGQPVTAERAGALLAKARSILDWIEDGLPEGVRRPRFERRHNVEFFIPLVLPKPPPEQT